VLKQLLVVCSYIGRPVSKSTYSRLWKRVRGLTLTPEQLSTPLMGVL